MNPAIAVLSGLILAQAALPDPAKLVREIEAHQRRMDELRENYTFREVMLTDDLASDGVNGYRIARLIKKSGKDLSEGERKSEENRIRSQINEDMKAPPGHSYNRRGENVGVSQILPLMKITNPRRVTLNGRSTLAYDFIGDPHVKAHGIAENAARRIAGTVWIDEADHEVSRLEARFDDNFRIGGGFVASIQKGTSLIFEQSRLNQELWMPSMSEIHLAARELLVKSVRQNIHIKDSDFRRFDVGVVQQMGPARK